MVPRHFVSNMLLCWCFAAAPTCVFFFILLVVFFVVGSVVTNVSGAQKFNVRLTLVSGVHRFNARVTLEQQSQSSLICNYKIKHRSAIHLSPSHYFIILINVLCVCVCVCVCV
jgi:hypothetical protein